MPNERAGKPCWWTVNQEKPIGKNKRKFCKDNHIQTHPETQEQLVPFSSLNLTTNLYTFDSQASYPAWSQQNWQKSYTNCSVKGTTSHSAIGIEREKPDNGDAILMTWVHTGEPISSSDMDK